MSLAPSPRRAAEAAALLALLLFVAGRCLVPMDETDLFFNLRLGEVILGTHAVPRTNLLSFTFPDGRDVNLAWLFQIVLALAHRAGGVRGTVLLKTGFVVSTFAVLYRVARRRGAHPAAAALALALAAWTAEPRFVERPHLVTFLGLGLTLLALERAEAGRSRALALLLPAGLVWANANSCYFLAPGVLLLYALGARLDRRRKDARRAGILALALLPLILATPSGVHALGYIANHFRMPTLRPLQEYRTASWPTDGPFFLLAAAMLLAFWWRPRKLREALPALALGLLGARRIRFVAEFALLAGPIVAVAITRLGIRLAARSRTGGAPSTNPHANPSPTLAVAALLLGLTVAPRVAAARRGERWLDVDLEPDLVPTAAIAFATENGLRARMYNDLEVGSYLTWEGWPRARVFQDPRINGYPEEMHAVLRRPTPSRAEWDAFLDRFGVTSALISYPDLNPRAALFDPARWALLYRAADGLVFARRSPDRGTLIARAELPVTFAYGASAGVTSAPIVFRPAQSPLPDCEWRRRLGDYLVEAGAFARARRAYEQALDGAIDCLTPPARRLTRLGLGDLAMRSGDPATAADAYAGLADAEARTKRGMALLALHREQEALDDFVAALAETPQDSDALLGEGLALDKVGRSGEAIAALRSFLQRAPNHLAASFARAALRRLGAR